MPFEKIITNFDYELLAWAVMTLALMALFFTAIIYSKLFDDGDDVGDPVSCPHGHLDWDDCPDCGH